LAFDPVHAIGLVLEGFNVVEVVATLDQAEVQEW
jgi:hypothetical protein